MGPHTPPHQSRLHSVFSVSFSVLLVFSFDNRSASLHFPHLLVLSIVGLLCSTVLHFGLRPMVEVRGNVRCGLGIAIKSSCRLIFQKIMQPKMSYDVVYLFC